MANTYTQIHIQSVFSVQNRDCIIKKAWKAELIKSIILRASLHCSFKNMLIFNLFLFIVLLFPTLGITAEFVWNPLKLSAHSRGEDSNLFLSLIIEFLFM